MPGSTLDERLKDLPTYHQRMEQLGYLPVKQKDWRGKVFTYWARRSESRR